ncbi:MAG: MFS transporter [Burkholderiales bacterium]|nr:MFS transporter [Burkholderiales bacterium]
MVGRGGLASCSTRRTYIAVIVTFLMIRVTPSRRSWRRNSPLMQGLGEGIAYAWRSVPIRLLLVLLTLVGLLATPYIALMPALVREAFQGNASHMGYMVSAPGLGAVAGTLYLASRANVRGLVPLLIFASFAAGIALILLAKSGMVWVALPLLMLIKPGVLVTSVSINMILQTIVDDDKRGRVMSFYTAASPVLPSFGSLAAGALADAVGVATTLFIGGAGYAAGARTSHANARRSGNMSGRSTSGWAS